MKIEPLSLKGVDRSETENDARRYAASENGNFVQNAAWWCCPNWDPLWKKSLLTSEGRDAPAPFAQQDNTSSCPTKSRITIICSRLPSQSTDTTRSYEHTESFNLESGRLSKNWVISEGAKDSHRRRRSFLATFKKTTGSRPFESSKAINFLLIFNQPDFGQLREITSFTCNAYFLLVVWQLPAVHLTAVVSQKQLRDIQCPKMLLLTSKKFELNLTLLGWSQCCYYIPPSAFPWR